MRRRSERGSAIIMLFIAVALFAILAYAFMQGSRTSTSWLEKERGNAASTGAQDCTHAFNLAMKRLEARGCGEFISTEEDGSNPNLNAPTDGSCSIYHPNGGGAKVCTGIASNNQYPCGQAPAIGDLCTDGTYYIGTTPDGNDPLYMAAANAGVLEWGGAWGVGPFRNITNFDTGQANTTALAAFGPTHPSGHPAAATCDSLTIHGHNDWYLPAVNELYLVMEGGIIIGGANMPDMDDGYWSSSENDMSTAEGVYLDSGTTLYGFSTAKEYVRPIRCVRKGADF